MQNWSTLAIFQNWSEVPASFSYVYFSFTAKKISQICELSCKNAHPVRIIIIEEGKNNFCFCQFSLSLIMPIESTHGFNMSFNYSFSLIRSLCTL
jgi:hypothetical protein